MGDLKNYTDDCSDYGVVQEPGNREYAQKEPLHIISVVIYSISFVLGVLGNGIVILVTAFKSKRTVNSVWLQNLVMADFVFLLFLPFYIDYVLRDFHWSFGMVMCKLKFFILMVNMYASMLFLMVLSLNISLVHLTGSRLCMVRRAWCICSGLWGMAVALSVPSLIFRHTGVIAMVTVQTVVGFLLPFSSMTVSSILLVARIRRSDSARMPSFSRTISALILAFMFCWASFHIFSIMELSTYSLMPLHAFNSCVKPLIYLLLDKEVCLLLKRSCLEIAPVSCATKEPIALTTDIEAYAMKEDRKRGVCLIINNYDFSQSNLKDRKGTDMDETCLEVFQWLGFETRTERDCGQQQMRRLVEQLSREDHSNRDCVVCCVLSHGDLGVVYGVDGAELSLRDLMEPFSGTHCVTLREKPKLFFIQACQGGKIQLPVPVQSDSLSAAQMDVATDAVMPWDSIPDDDDFLLGMATVPDYASFRDKKEGTWFIQSLCQNLVQLVPDGHNLLSILTKVNHHVSGMPDGTHTKKQMPQHASSLRKRVVFPVPWQTPPTLKL